MDCLNKTVILIELRLYQNHFSNYKKSYYSLSYVGWSGAGPEFDTFGFLVLVTLKVRYLE